MTARERELESLLVALCEAVWASFSAETDLEAEVSGKWLFDAVKAAELALPFKPREVAQ